MTTNRNKNFDVKIKSRRKNLTESYICVYVDNNILKIIDNLNESFN